MMAVAVAVLLAALWSHVAAFAPACTSMPALSQRALCSPTSCIALSPLIMSKRGGRKEAHGKLCAGREDRRTVDSSTGHRVALPRPPSRDDMQAANLHFARSRNMSFPADSSGQPDAPAFYLLEDYQELFRSVDAEVDIEVLHVEGTVPPGLSGSYFVTGPGILVQDQRNVHPFDGHACPSDCSATMSAFILRAPTLPSDPLTWTCTRAATVSFVDSPSTGRATTSPLRVASSARAPLKSKRSAWRSKRDGAPPRRWARVACRSC